VRKGRPGTEWKRARVHAATLERNKQGGRIMSFDHKAYRFDWSRFQAELAPVLLRALQDDDAEPLARFVDANLAACSSPYDGEPLDADWRDALEARDVQELADFALTCFYKPADSLGLGDAWLALSESLAPGAQAALLGTPFGPEGRLFDPGRQGSYFQSAAQLRESSAALGGAEDADLARFRQDMDRIAGDGEGLYVTF
jgi:hypothetical protein